MAKNDFEGILRVFLKRGKNALENETAAVNAGGVFQGMAGRCRFAATPSKTRCKGPQIDFMGAGYG